MSRCRIIINNQTGLPETSAIEMVYKVMRKGKISDNGKQYCYLTTFKSGVECTEFMVWCTLTKNGTQSFRISEQTRNELDGGLT